MEGGRGEGPSAVKLAMDDGRGCAVHAWRVLRGAGEGGMQSGSVQVRTTEAVLRQQVREAWRQA